MSQRAAILVGLGGSAGGAVHLSGATLVARDTLVADNAAASTGGGVYADNSRIDW
jgi:hypothetical protein